MEKKMKLTWDETWMLQAKLASKRGTCCKRQVGACIVRDNFLISTGYNGTPKGYKNCNEGGCFRCNHPEQYPSGIGYDVCTCAHAERNAIDISARLGISTEGTSMYIAGYNSIPCIACSISIIQAGIIEVCTPPFDLSSLPESLNHDLLEKTSIKVRQIVLRESILKLFEDIDNRIDGLNSHV